MLESIAVGSGFAFAAAIQPGPLQAFLLCSVTQKGWKRTLPAAFSPLLSDGPIAVLALMLLTTMPLIVSKMLQAAGGFFLIYLAWSGFHRWKQQTKDSDNNTHSGPRTLFQAAMVNILNPGPYLGWSLVLGPAVLTAWQQTPANGAALVIAFYTTMVISLAAIILLFGTTRFLGPKGRRMLILLSAVTLAALGVYQLITAVIRTGAL